MHDATVTNHHSEQARMRLLLLLLIASACIAAPVSRVLQQVL